MTSAIKNSLALSSYYDSFRQSARQLPYVWAAEWKSVVGSEKAAHLGVAFMYMMAAGRRETFKSIHSNYLREIGVIPRGHGLSPKMTQILFKAIKEFKFLTSIQLTDGEISDQIEPTAVFSIKKDLLNLTSLQSIEFGNIPYLPTLDGIHKAIRVHFAQLPFLTSLDLKGLSNRLSTGLATILQRHSPHLTSLNLSCSKLSRRAFSRLSPHIATCTSLKTLDYSGCTLVNDHGHLDLFASLLSNLTALTLLNLSQEILCDMPRPIQEPPRLRRSYDVRQLGDSLAKLTRLQSLNLSHIEGFHPMPRDLATFLPKLKLPSLTSLDLSYNTLKASGLLGQVLSHLTNLETLNLASTGLISSDIAMLVPSFSITLTHLTLYDNNIGELDESASEGATALLQLTGLVFLDLSVNNLSNKEVVAFTQGALSFTRLTTLQLQNNGTKAEDPSELIEALASTLKGHPTLQYLQLTTGDHDLETHQEAQFAEIIAALEYNPTIRGVYFDVLAEPESYWAAYNPQPLPWDIYKHPPVPTRKQVQTLHQIFQRNNHNLEKKIPSLKSLCTLIVSLKRMAERALKTPAATNTRYLLIVKPILDKIAFVYRTSNGVVIEDGRTEERLFSTPMPHK